MEMYPRTPTHPHTTGKILHTPPSTASSSSSPGHKTKFLRALSGKVFRRDTAPVESGQAPSAYPAQFSPLPTAGPVRRHVPKPLMLGSPVSLPRSRGNRSSRSSRSSHCSPRDLTPSLHEADMSADPPLLAPLVPRMATTARRELQGALCAVCGEPSAVSLAGEKCLELHCGHAVHFECYCALLGMRRGLGLGQGQGQGLAPCPECGDCEGPLDRAALLQAEAAAVLTTPLDQVIQPQDVGSHGFCPGEVQLQSQSQLHRGVSPDTSGGSTTVSFEGLDDALYDEILRLTEDGTAASSDTEVESPVETGEPPPISVHTVQQGDDVVVSVAAVHSASGSTDSVFRLDQANPLPSPEEHSLRHDITVHVAAELGEPGPASTGPLLLRDTAQHSLDGLPQWDTLPSTAVYCFGNSLTLQDPRTQAVCGRVPRDQLSSATVLPDQRTLLLALKSTALPELYIRFPTSERCRTWQRCLGGGEHPGLSSLITTTTTTTTATSILPAELHRRLEAVRAVPQHHQDPLRVPVRIILCVDVSQGASAASACIAAALGALGPRDLLGVVLAGRNGAGQSGPWGTFVGMLPPGWPGWPGWHGLDTGSGPGVFDTPEQVAETMLETCRRLAATVQEPLGGKPRFYDCVLLVGGEPFSPTALRHRNKIEQQGFDVGFVSAEEVGECVAQARRTSIHGLTLDLGGKRFPVGNLAPGQERTFTMGRSAFRNRVCDAHWWDIATQQNVSHTLQVILG